jgi:hypothetical protein
MNYHWVITGFRSCDRDHNFSIVTGSNILFKQKGLCCQTVTVLYGHTACWTYFIALYTCLSGTVNLLSGGVCGFGTGVGIASPALFLWGDSNSWRSRSRSRPGLNASNNASTRSSVGPQRWYPALFCSQTTRVPCADLTFNSLLRW